MRRVIEEIEKAPDRKLDRKTLEKNLMQEGYDRSHVLRSIRSLHRTHLVRFNDARRLEDSLVSLPEPVKFFTEEEIFALIASLGDKDV